MQKREPAQGECNGDHRLFTLLVEQDVNFTVPNAKWHVGTSNLKERYAELADFLNEGESVTLYRADRAKITIERKA